jgi:hypothetical protein
LDIVRDASSTTARFEDRIRLFVRDSVGVLFLVPTMALVPMVEFWAKHAVHLEFQAVQMGTSRLRKYRRSKVLVHRDAYRVPFGVIIVYVVHEIW